MFVLQGCAAGIKTLEILSRPAPKTPLNIDLPAPLKLKEVEWIIINENNAEEVWNKLKEDPKQDVGLFALDQEGYETISTNFADIRIAIAEHRNIIIAYKDYYETVHENE